MFTSGTTGSPKGVIHPLQQAAGWHSYLVYGLGITDDDVYWCAADPGWAYGLYSGLVAPLALGSGVIIQCGPFAPQAAWELIERLGVTNFTAAPTVYRALRNHFPTVPSKGRLRRLSSAGEPLTPEVNVWASSQLGLTVHDHFGQTEVGMVIGNAQHPQIARQIVPGSMGYPLPGWSTIVIGEDNLDEKPIGEVGRVAIDVAHSPAMTFRSYQDQTKTASRFAGDGRYYLLGDLGYRDAHGAYHFASRDDDVIIMAGYRIGPFEIESVLSEHPSVAESAAVAAPDADRGEVLEAYVVLAGGRVGSPELEKELQSFVKTHYAAHAYPRVVHFVAELPKTPSGKIQRFVLREQRRSELKKGRQP
jgi:acetyl-CoA synthetase